MKVIPTSTLLEQIREIQLTQDFVVHMPAEPLSWFPRWFTLTVWYIVHRHSQSANSGL